MNRKIKFVTTLAATIAAGLLTTSLARAADRPGSDKKREQSAVRPSTGGNEGGIAGGTLNGPDVIVSSMAAGTMNWGAVSGTAAYSFTSVSCNIGEADAIWIDANFADLLDPLYPQRNQHPVIGETLYRLKGGRFEQIGMGWLKHGFCAADQPSCGTPYEANLSCDWLGTNATDTYSANRNGIQSTLGPRSEVNPWTGVYPYPNILEWQTSSTDVRFKRMQVSNSDLDPAQNAGAVYFAECQYICTDEQAINRYNNVSYRPYVVGTFSAGLGAWNIGQSGGTVTQQPAINAWRAADPTVVLSTIDVPGDGRMIIGCKVTNIGGGNWSYEYALYNMNCDRSAQSFSVPIPNGVTLSSTGFHDVNYHSGEPYASTDWPATLGGGAQSWATQTSTENVNANALRWGTTYNFRFTASAPPRCTTTTIGLFKPGSPTGVTIGVPGPSGCVGDIVPVGIGNGNVDVNDLLAVITSWGSCGLLTSTCGCPSDISPDGGNDSVDVNDLLKVITTWGPCP